MERTNVQVSQKDQEILYEPGDTTDQSDTYFGPRNLDQEAEIEIDMVQEGDDSDYAGDGPEFESE